jgi:redox-sensitive bicupin YhaK (pirin superfamily)
MLDLRPFDRLGTFANDWLNAHYHFSFADYHDPRRMGLGHLRVWNDDLIQPHTGFPPHGHRDMEIITYVREGAISHEDSLGNKGRTEAGQVQVMSAGTGISHAEFNHEDTPIRLFQIWIQPKTRGMAPRWEVEPFPRQHGTLQVLASGLEGDGGLKIHQSARVLGATLDKGDRLEHASRLPYGYLVPARGSLVVNGISVPERSGLAISNEQTLTIEATADCELVLVESE